MTEFYVGYRWMQQLEHEFKLFGTDNFERIQIMLRSKELVDDINRYIDSKVYGSTNLVDIQSVADVPIGSKDSKLSTKNRIIGNKHFAKNQWKDSVRYFTLAILWAPDSSIEQSGKLCGSELASAYGNRSASFFQLGQYELCVVDIDLALDAGHGDPRKLLLRKVESLIELKRFLEARELLGKINFNKNDKRFRELRMKLAKELDSYLYHCQTIDLLGRGNHLPELDGGLVPRIKIFDPTQFISSLSAKVEVCYGRLEELDGTVAAYSPNYVTQSKQLKQPPQLQRYFRARETINPGEAIIADNPYASLLFPDYELRYCHHCCCQLSIGGHTLVPCTQCSNVLYCSIDCRRLSWTNYHQYECKFWSCLFKDNEHLAYRILLITGLPTIWQTWKQFQNQSGDYKTQHGFFTEQQQRRNGSVSGRSSTTLKTQASKRHLKQNTLQSTSQDIPIESSWFSLIYNLPHHSDRYEFEDIFQYTVSACLLLQLAKRSGFMQTIPQLEQNCVNDLEVNGSWPTMKGSWNQPPRVDYDRFVGGMLLRFIMQLKINGFMTKKLLTSEHNYQATHNCNFVNTVAPTMSLFGQSCDPNIGSKFRFGTQPNYVRALRSIKPGEILCAARSAITYPAMPVQLRQKFFNNKHFVECRCWICCAETEQSQLLESLNLTSVNRFNPLACSKCRSMIIQNITYRCSNREQCESADLTRQEVETRYIAVDRQIRQVKYIMRISNFLAPTQNELDILDNSMAKLIKLLHIKSVLLLEIFRNLRELFERKKNWNKAKEFATLLLDSVEAMYGTECAFRFMNLTKLAEIHYQCFITSASGTNQSERATMLDDCYNVTKSCLEALHRFSPPIVADPFYPAKTDLDDCCYYKSEIGQFSKRLTELERLIQKNLR